VQAAKFVQGLQIESGTRIKRLLVRMTFRSSQKKIAASACELRKVRTRAETNIIWDRNYPFRGMFPETVRP
jgi:hypothetical protein